MLDDGYSPYTDDAVISCVGRGASIATGNLVPHRVRWFVVDGKS